jgi:hypothetical protein
MNDASVNSLSPDGAKIARVVAVVAVVAEEKEMSLQAPPPERMTRRAIYLPSS